MLKKYYTQSEEQDDLISIGTIGLIKGISTFKPEKGARLATYAARCVEKAIFSYKNFAYSLPRAKPLFPTNEYPNQLLGTSLKLNQALTSFIVSPCSAFVYRKWK